MKCSVIESIDRIADLGFRGIELMADVPHVWPATTSDEEIDSIRRHLEDRGLTLSNVNAFMMNAVGDFWRPSWIERDDALRRQRIQHTIDAIIMAKKLGAPSITTEPGGPVDDGQSHEAALEVFASGLAEVLRHAEEEGIQLLVEPEPGLLVEDSAQFLDLALRVESPMFGLNFDVGHFYCVGEPLPVTIERLQHLTAHYHIEDIAANRVHEHLIPGRGAIDFAAVLSAIGATGYDGWLTVELYPYLDDPDGAGREAAHHLAPWLSR